MRIHRLEICVGVPGKPSTWSLASGSDLEVQADKDGHNGVA